MQKARAKVSPNCQPLTDRFCHKDKGNRKNGALRKGSDQLPSKKVQNSQKSTHSKKDKKLNLTRITNHKFHTEAGQKSEYELLTIPSFPLGKDSIMNSNSGLTNQYDDDYEITRTFFRPKNKEKQRNKSRKQSQQIEPMTYQMANVNKIKKRMPQNKSLSKGKSFKGKSKKSKSNSQFKLLPKTSRNSQASPQPKKKYLSPEIAKLQSSYCFQKDQEKKAQTQTQSICKQKSLPNVLLPPKRKSMLLFDSNGSLWRSNQPHNLLRSTIDLLN